MRKVNLSHQRLFTWFSTRRISNDVRCLFLFQIPINFHIIHRNAAYSERALLFLNILSTNFLSYDCFHLIWLDLLVKTP
jgi:hypothetical protein